MPVEAAPSLALLGWGLAGIALGSSLHTASLTPIVAGSWVWVAVGPDHSLKLFGWRLAAGPKGMHHRTFERHIERYCELDDECGRETLIFLGRMGAGLGLTI